MTDSSETRTALLENNYNLLNKSMEKLSNKIDHLSEKFDSLPEKLDERYASKATEIAVNKLMWIVITAVVLALLSLVIIKN
jgi:predicted transcriptional regulator